MKESLDFIRKKVDSLNFDFNEIETQALKEVYEFIQETIVGAKRKLDASCQSCIKTAVMVVKNYIDFHEVKEVKEVIYKSKKQTK